MKKILSIIVVVSLCLALVFCNLTTKKVSRVYIEGASSITTSRCYTVYLYAFRDAVIDPIYESSSSTETPSASGYIYSTEKLEDGDTIKVWSDFRFGEKNSVGFSDDRQYGTDAIVDKVVDVYWVKVKSHSDTYTITYYSSDTSWSYTSVSNKNNLVELEKHQVEVTKDRVIIEYEV